MVDDEQLKALALALPEVTGGVSESGQFGYEVGGKGIAWGYLARPAPKAKRVLIPGVAAVRCPMETKVMLIEAAPDGSSPTTTIAAIRRCWCGCPRSRRTSWRGCSSRPGRSWRPRRSRSGIRTFDALRHAGAEAYLLAHERPLQA